LIEQAECDTTLLFHNTVDHLRIKFDLQSTQRRLDLREVVDLRGNVLSIEIDKVLLKLDLLVSVAKWKALEVALTWWRTRGSWTVS
jgi:hypothetical protein